MSNAIVPMPPFAWQEQIWRGFYSLIRDNKLPHAFLLEAQKGIGADDLALAMGQYLLCASPLNSVACGRCKSCLLLDSGTHPDLTVVKPEEKATHIKIDQIRHVAEFVAKTAQQGGMKIVIIEPAEAMNLNAANALLKSLEEPAGNTIFFIVTYSGNRVLPTIRSRCTQYLLIPPSADQALQWLAESGVEHADLALFEALGAPLLAKSWLEDGTIEKRVEVLKGLEMMADRSLEPLSFARKWAKEEPIDVIGPMIRCLEAALASTLASRQVPEHYLAISRVLNRQTSSMLFRLLDQLKIKKKRVLSSPNLNANLVVEEVALDWASVVTKS